MTRVEHLLCDADLRSEPEARRIGEAARDEAERIARRDPRELAALYRALREAARRSRIFRPWAWWIEGGVEQLRGRPAAAAPLLRDAARSFRRRGDEHLAARVDLALIDALACMGRHQIAARRGRRALETFSRLGDTDRMVSALLNLGGLADGRDRVHEAIRLWRRARGLLRPDDLLRRGLVEGSLASAYQALGRFHRAQRCSEEAAALLEQAGAAATAIQVRLGAAEIRALLGDIGSALTDIQQLEARAAQLEDDNLRGEARLLLVRLELDLGQPVRALHLADASLEESRRRGRLDDVARLAALRALAVAGAEDAWERRRDDDAPTVAAAVDEAELELARAGLRVAAAAMRVELIRLGREGQLRALRRDARELERSGLLIQAGVAKVELARTLLGQGRALEAVRLCRAVLAHRHASVWPRLEAWRLLADAAPDAGTAIRCLRRAARLAESVRGRLSSEADRAAVSVRASSVFERLVELLLLQGDARSRRQAFDLVARVKSRGLLEALDRRRDHEWRQSPELVQRWNAMRQELGAMLAALEGRPESTSRYSVAVITDRARQLSRRLEDLELEIARAYPSLGDVLGRVDPPRLRPLLRSGEVLLELFLTGTDLVVFTLRAQGLGVRVHQGARVVVEQAVAALRFQLSKASYGRGPLEKAGRFLVGQARSRLATLGELILEPLAGSDLDSVSRIWLAPHGELHNIPMAALELGGAPLLEHCPVAVAPGSAVLARLLERPHPRPERLGIAGVATAGLPEIDREIEALRLRLADAEVLQTTSLAALRSMLGRCDAVHVASHGAFQPLLPAGSGVRLDDGWLTALDLLETPIRAGLVSLAVCSSGQVAVMPGEEVMGIVRALIAAGVRSAVVAPGVLDDVLARQAAVAFFDGLAELGPGEALRRALLAVREEHPHPALWSALQLYGSSRPWEEEAR